MRNATTNTRSPKLPTHIAYQVEDREGQKSFWTRIGGAWTHSDGNGLTLQLASMPLSGRITLRVNQPKKKP
jgi:hypothetical protein